MTKNKTKIKKTTSDMLTSIVVNGIQEKKGKEISILNFKSIHNTLFDYFVICHGTSRTHVDAIADSVQDEVKKAIGISPLYKEGFLNSEWILLDYVDIIVHIFQKDTRTFYQLEKLWADAEIDILEDVL